jgi:hypothetical protein
MYNIMILVALIFLIVGFVILIAWLLNPNIFKAEGDTCTVENGDVNGIYTVNAKKECVLSNCTTGWTMSGTTCVEKSPSYIVFDEKSQEGVESTDCVISGYTSGPCKREGKILTGYGDLYGEGTLEKYATVSAPATGLGKCDDMKLTETCYVNPVPACKAPAALWTSEGENCTAIINGQTRTLATGSGYCGVGTKIKTLKESNITPSMRGTMTVDEYKTSVNWNACQETQSSSCNVLCGDNDVASECPNTTGMTWIAAGEGACYKKNDAIAVIKGEMAFEDIEVEPPITRQEAIESGALKDGVIDASLLRKGLNIFYLAGGNFSREELREKGCSIYYTKECEPVRTSVNCAFDEDPGTCGEIACGVKKERIITRTVTLPAWGNLGTCDIVGTEPTSTGCDTAPDCCDSKYVGDWKAVEGYDGCVTDPSDNAIKRKYTRTGNGAKCAESNDKYQYDVACNIDCQLTSVTLSDSQRMSQAGITGNVYARRVTNLVTRAPKGTGKSCPEEHLIRNGWYKSSTELDNQLDTYYDDVSAPPYSFTCARNAIIQGSCGTVDGVNCGPSGNGAVLGPC